MIVNRDLAALCPLDAQTIKVQTVVEGLAACGDQNDVGIQRVFAVILAQFIGDLGLGFCGVGTLHRSTHNEIDTLLFQ
jgi:hypothetical protein